MTTSTPESPKMIDLLRQMREATSIGEKLTALAGVVRALDYNEVSEAEGAILRKDFGKIIGETVMRMAPLQ
ncbi:MAG: hypothetical protein Q8L39_10645 [Burkholderiales bacterium]|nr:hypothetical protein [Burkholderiales bacterium]